MLESSRPQEIKILPLGLEELLAVRRAQVALFSSRTVAAPAA